jgi:O-antigen/teichoic acid export membrane protein
LSDGGKSESRPGGSGAVLGAQVVRYSSIFSGGLVVTNLLAFASTIVVAHLLSPAEFGQFALLLFLAGLLNLAFNLGSKQGTMRRVYGADDDEDDDDDEEDEALSQASRRSLGTGIVLTTLLAAVGTGMVVLLASQIADLLLGGSGDREVVLWAAAAGGLGAIYRLASLAVWMERRPVAFVILESAQPLLILAAVIALVAAGGGLEGAIAGTAIGTAISTVLTVLALRGSFQLSFDMREALMIMRLGAPRIPVHASFWTINSSQVFFLSRFVSHTDLGIFTLAQRAGIVVALLPTGFRRALRPLKRTTAFAAVEDQYGSNVARGQQLGYFLLVTLASLLAITLLADPVVSLAPPEYADAAPLIPLMAAAMVSPTVFRMLNKSAKYRRKRRIFIYSAVVAGLTFVAACLALIPWLGLEGAPVAMMVAFAVPGAYIFYLSQSGKEPIAMPYRSLALATILAAAFALGYYALDPSSIIVEIALSLLLLLAWAALVFATVIPSYHRRPLIHMARATIGRGHARFDSEDALRALDPEDREALRMAIVERRPLEEIGATLGADGGAEQVARALRRAADLGGALAGTDSEHDAAIAEYLFSSQTVAGRDLTAKRLIRDEGVSPGDLRELEAVLDKLERVPEEAWRSGRVPAGAGS